MEAQELYERALRGQSSTLGDDHPSTLMTVQDLAVLLQHRHHYDKAMEMWERLLQGQESSLGKLDTSTLLTLHRMATMLNEQVATHNLHHVNTLINTTHVTTTTNTLLTLHRMATMLNEQVSTHNLHTLINTPY